MAGESYNRHTNSSLCIWLSAFMFRCEFVAKRIRGYFIFVFRSLCVIWMLFRVSDLCSGRVLLVLFCVCAALLPVYFCIPQSCHCRCSYCCCCRYRCWLIFLAFSLLYCHCVNIFFCSKHPLSTFFLFFHSVHSHSRLFNPASVVCLFVFSSAPAFVVVHFNSFHFQFMWLCAVYALYLCQLVCSFVILYPSTTITLPLLNPHTYGCLLDALRLLRFYLYFACLFVVSCMSFNLCVFSLGCCLAPSVVVWQSHKHRRIH